MTERCDVARSVAPRANRPAAETLCLAACSLALLMLGAAVCVVMRPPGVLFLPNAWQLDWASAPLGPVFGALPPRSAERKRQA